MTTQRLLLVWTAFVVLVGGSSRPAGADDADPHIPVEKYQLENGLEVLLHRDATVPLAYVSVWYHVASGDETPGKSGFAHLFEHMMFQGSQHVGEDRHFDVLRKIGASEINGSTNTDRTNYFEQVPSHQLETALWLESDRMGYLLPLLTEKSLANQRDVVRNERRQNLDNVPYGRDRIETARALYAEGHPYRHLVIGLHEDLAKASVEDVKAFFRKWYAPANATLLVAGDIDIAATKKLIDKWFGSFPRTDKPVRRPAAFTPVTATKRITITDDAFAKLRRVHYAWHSPKSLAPGDAELDVLASVLARSGTGRLYKILVHEKQWAQSVAAFQQSQDFSGIFHVQADLKPEADLAEVEKILDAEIERAIKDLVTERERKRVVTEVEASSVRSLETLVARGETLQMYNHTRGVPDSISYHLDLFRKTSAEGIRVAAGQYLQKRNRVEIITLPMAGKGVASQGVK